MCNRRFDIELWILSLEFSCGHSLGLCCKVAAMRPEGQHPPALAVLLQLVLPPLALHGLLWLHHRLETNKRKNNKAKTNNNNKATKYNNKAKTNNK